MVGYFALSPPYKTETHGETDGGCILRWVDGGVDHAIGENRKIVGGRYSRTATNRESENRKESKRRKLQS